MRVLRSYGCGRSRKFSPYRQSLIDGLLPDISLSLDNRDEGLLPNWKHNFAGVYLEIGFGDGETITANALANPLALFIGAEAYQAGVAGLLKRIADNQINNIMIFCGDAKELLAKLPDNFIDGIYIHYPDPWPKQRHHIRRLIQSDFLTECSRALKSDGFMQVVTDDTDYAAHIKKTFENSQSFRSNLAASNTPPAGWVTTRYEQKALKAGRVPNYFIFPKTS